MFRKKKLYEIVWHAYLTKTSIIEAKDETQALRKFYKKYDCFVPSIISFREISVAKEN